MIFRSSITLRGAFIAYILNSGIWKSTSYARVHGRLFTVNTLPNSQHILSSKSVAFGLEMGVQEVKFIGRDQQPFHHHHNMKQNFTVKSTTSYRPIDQQLNHFVYDDYVLQLRSICVSNMLCSSCTPELPLLRLLLLRTRK